ncbi:MAG: efflux transporter outer membrane subunit [Hyphomonadaceae bacterium]
MPRHTLLAGISAAVLAACTTAGPDFERPSLPTESGYVMSGDPATSPLASLGAENADIGQWWTAFNSPALNALVDQALAGNPTLQAADASLARARELERAQNGENGPTATLSGNVGRERVNTAAFGIDGFPSPTISVFSLGSALKYDLDLFGGNRRKQETAAARTEAARQRMEATYLNLTGEVVARAIELAALRAQLDALDRIIEVDNKTIEMIRRGIAAGGSPASALNPVDAQLAEDQAGRPALLRRIATTRHALALLMGQSPAGWSAPDIDLDDITLPGAIPVSLPSELVRKRPDILAAEADLHAATAAIGVAEAARYPDLSLDASFVLTALHPEDIFDYNSSGWSFGPSVKAPLFDGGALKSRQRAAVATAQEADAVYRKTVLAAFGQVSDLLSALSTDQALIAAQARARDVANENARLAALAYENGAGSLISVIDAQRQAQRTQLAAIEAEALLRADMAELYVATAATWRPGKPT